MPTANIFYWFFGVLGSSLMETLFQILVIGGPFVLLTLLLHWLAITMQTRLARRFGWKAVLWTGWLGTPLHELSHAAMCLVFRHNIEKIVLFEPDEESGKLGYVWHSYDPQNWYQVAGNFFIGTAPLLGGTLALYLLLWLLEPTTAREALGNSDIGTRLAEGNYTGAIAAFVGLTYNVVTSIVTLENLATWQFWLFLYLALCVGGHLAPSPEDYRGGWAGGLLTMAILSVTLFAVNFFVLAFGGQQGWLVALIAPVLGPCLALFALCAILSGLGTALVVGFTRLLDTLLGPAPYAVMERPEGSGK